MQMDELLKFIEVESEHIKKAYFDDDNVKAVLAITVKISEELGGLSEQVLAHSSMQRKDKLQEIDKSKLSEEFADVLITALILAKTMNIDIKSALKLKIEKINQRYH